MRLILNHVRPKDKEELAEDLKEVFNTFDLGSNLTKAKEKVAKFIEK